MDNTRLTWAKKVTLFPGLAGNADEIRAVTESRSNPEVAAMLDFENKWYGGVPVWGQDGPRKPDTIDFETALKHGRIKCVPVTQVYSGVTHRWVRVENCLPPR